MNKAVITGSGLFIPPYSISNKELVASFNGYVEHYNQIHKDNIAQGKIAALLPSSEEFILKASGIQNRYVMEKSGILDSAIMSPRNLERTDQELSIQAEMCVKAATQALENAHLNAGDIDFVLIASSNFQRAYPAISIEVQHALGIKGFAFDMNVACASASFGLKVASDSIQQGSAARVLLLSPEICSGHINFRDRESHFIFGDACTALILESSNVCQHKKGFSIESTRLLTQFSNNIRNNKGFLNHTTPETENAPDKLFRQQGRKVFKEVVPMVAEFISQHLKESSLGAQDIKRFWLHQANQSMNELIIKKVVGESADLSKAPIVLNEFANTSSAGAIIAFHRHHQDFQLGELGLLSSFGAGYSVGSILLKCVGSP